jgi:DNA repair ATPase RecN
MTDIEIPSGEGDSRLNNVIALLVAITATFMALCNVKDGNIVQGMAQAQSSAVDTWSYYQSKSTKQSVAEGILDQLRVERELVATTATPANLAILDRKIAEYAAKEKRYDREKAEIKKEAEGFQKQYDALNVHDDQFDMSEACLSVAIALLGVTALTKRTWLLLVAGAFLLFGVAFGLAGFLGWSLHPDFLARLLT